MQGLLPTTLDVCLYTNKEKILFVVTHADDFQVMGPGLDKIEQLMHILYQKYKFKTFKIDLFLGINIGNPTKNVTKLSQEHYTLKFLGRHGLANCKTVEYPI